LRMRNQMLLAAPPRSIAAATPMSSAADLVSEAGAGDSSPPGLSVSQVIAILWAYRFVSAIIACVVLVVGVVATKLLPKTYTATATLMVNNNISDPLAGKAPDERVAWNFLPTEVQLMESPEVLVGVVDKLKLTQQREFMGGGCRGAGVEFQRCVAGNLFKTLVVEQGPPGSLLIDVTAAAHDPALAADIANAVADTYLENQRKRLEAPEIERATRYAQQLAELEAKVHSAQAQVADFRQRTGVVELSAAQTTGGGGTVVDLAGQTTVEEDILAGLKRKLDDAQGARRGAEVKAMGNQLLSPDVMASDSVRALKTQLATEKSKLAELTSTLGSNHPKVKELLAQIQSTEAEIAAEVSTLTRTNSASITSETELEKKLQGAIAQQREKVLAMRKLRDEGNQYVLALESAQAVYKRALDGYDQIMFARAGKYNYVNLVTRATPPANAARPNKPKLALLAAVMGFGCGIVVPFVYELFVNRRIRCQNDLEVALGVRVLANFESTGLIPHTA
jgi:protein tyrosine kinase modulator